MLSAAFTKGRTDALAHFGVKTARSAVGLPMGVPMHPAIGQMHMDLHAAGTPAPAPATAPSTSWADMHKGVAQQQAANVNPTPAPLPAAQGLGRPAAPAPAATGGGGANRFMQPVKRGLGLAALGAAGAAAYGLHSQNQQDRDGHDLVYAPMQGAY